jgi:molybdopterin-guanine dinucleotide biosynthesis protein A
MRSAQITGYVLAGGASSRFGQDKALIELGGIPMVLRMCELLRGIAGEATVIAAPEKYAHLDLKIVPDRWPGEGPLGGIITALIATSAANPQDVGPDRPRQAGGRQWNLILGCDMPFLTGEWLTYLAERALASDAEVIAPRSAQGLEPLCACWRTSAFFTLQSAFDDGVRKITQAMKRLKMEIVDESGWKRFDSAGRIFWNMNMPADYEEAKRILAAEHM